MVHTFESFLLEKETTKEALEIILKECSIYNATLKRFLEKYKKIEYIPVSILSDLLDAYNESVVNFKTKQILSPSVKIVNTQVKKMNCATIQCLNQDSYYSQVYRTNLYLILLDENGLYLDHICPTNGKQKGIEYRTSPKSHVGHGSYMHEHADIWFNQLNNNIHEILVCSFIDGSTPLDSGFTFMDFRYKLSKKEINAFPNNTDMPDLDATEKMKNGGYIAYSFKKNINEWTIHTVDEPLPDDPFIFIASLKKYSTHPIL